MSSKPINRRKFIAALGLAGAGAVSAAVTARGLQPAAPADAVPRLSGFGAYSQVLPDHPRLSAQEGPCN
jgi:hypothetical protein